VKALLICYDPLYKLYVKWKTQFIQACFWYTKSLISYVQEYQPIVSRTPRLVILNHWLLHSRILEYIFTETELNAKLNPFSILFLPITTSHFFSWVDLNERNDFDLCCTLVILSKQYFRAQGSKTIYKLIPWNLCH